jgi:hypothetical protein
MIDRKYVGACIRAFFYDLLDVYYRRWASISALKS